MCWRHGASSKGHSRSLGLPGVFLLKTFMLIYVALLALQGVSMAARALLTIAGVAAENRTGQPHRGGVMTTGEWLSIAMMIGVFFFLATGFPVAFTLTGAALFFGLVGYAFDAFSLSFLGLTANRVFAVMGNEILIAVPLYVYMGIMLERSKVAEQLLETMGQLFGPIRGGLGVSVIVVGGLLGASSGIVGATVMAMGLISLPVMLRRGYDPAHTCGLIAATGTLGQIIPPAIVLVVLGDQISNANVQAQRALGKFSVDPVSVGDLMAGALLPEPGAGPAVHTRGSSSWPGGGRNPRLRCRARSWADVARHRLVLARPAGAGRTPGAAPGSAWLDLRRHRDADRERRSGRGRVDRARRPARRRQTQVVDPDRRRRVLCCWSCSRRRSTCGSVAA